MPIISVKDNENNRWKRNEKKNKGDGSYSDGVRDEWFCWAFKLGFLQSMCKAYLIFKLALSIILKERELYESKLVVVDCRCLKIWDFVIFFDMFLNLSFKMTAIELQLAQINL